MASTSGSKRPLGPPSPPTPPPHRLRQEEHVDADKPPSREGKEVPADDDDPPPETSQEALKRRQDPPRVDEHTISRLNYLLLQVSYDHHESLPNLSEIVARIFQTEGWRQLLWNLLQAIQTDFETRQETALRVLPCLPENQSCEFFKDNYSSLYVRFLDLFDSPNVNIQALTFDASSKLISLKTLFSLDGDSEYLLLKMSVWLLIAFLGGEIDLLEPRMTDLVAFVRDNAHLHVDESLHSVLTCMFEIVESADDNFITCKAIEIINILQKQNLNGVKQFVRELSKESKHRILEKCTRLMFRVEDVPSWYDIDAESSEHMGLLGTYEQAKFLLLEFSLDSDEELLLPFGTEMIPQYLNSEDWKTRHAGLIAFSLIAKACSPVI
ncbi:hypothetical protein K1719_029520 [Acacia pycnantha]|nr:hypothetical protein K1719_029520 [Acacia pycnantha]